MSALASMSTYPILHYRWNCGQSGNSSCVKDEITPMFSYLKQGDTPSTIAYTVTLTIEDDHGNQNTATTMVTVTQHY